MKKILCLILSILILAVGFNINSPVLAQENEFLLTDYKGNVKIQSRAAFTENGLEADFAGGGFVVSLDCQGDVKLTLDWSGDKGKLGVVINDDFENESIIIVENKGEQTITIAENLKKDIYKIEIVKQNSQETNRLIFKSLWFDGEMLEKPSDKELKIQFIGDSFSCGVGAEPVYEGNYYIAGFGDVYYHSYNMFCARKLNAEISTCAIPGYGYYIGASGNLNNNLYNYLDKALFWQDVAYDNSQFLADVVVIELGLNDYNGILNKECVVEDDQADAIVQNYIDKIRSYNKDCYIVLMAYGTNISNLSGRHYFKLANAIERAAAINEKVYLKQPKSIPLTGWVYHPNTQEAKILGEDLADYIEESVLGGKESPDAIDNKDFYLNFDVNGDDEITTVDVLYMRNFLVKKFKNAKDKEYDVNRDGKSDVHDLLDLRKRLARL